jgi:hypothetical protein
VVVQLVAAGRLLRLLAVLLHVFVGEGACMPLPGQRLLCSRGAHVLMGGAKAPGYRGAALMVTLRGRGTPWGGFADGVRVAHACSPASGSPAWIKRSARPASGASLDLSKGHLTT